MLFDGVPLGLHRGDAALGPVGRTGGDDILGDHHDRAQVAAFQRRGEPGDPGTEDHHVDLAHPARWLGGEPLGRTGNCGSRGIGGAALFELGRVVGHHGAMLPYFRPWFDAWVEYAYGAEGFWRHNSPDEHFRTAASGTGLIAELVSGLVVARPEITRVVDIGAGDGRLLGQLADRCADGRLRDLGCAELTFGPDPRSCRTESTGPRTCGTSGMRVGPVERPTRSGSGRTDHDHLRGVAGRPAVPGRGLAGRRVAPGRDRRIRHRTGGATARGAQLEWADRWWPRGGRAEIGLNRDRAWSSLIEVVIRCGGCALMIDYGHLAVARPVHGSLAAYREGRAVDPVPGPNLNLTAHVAVDAVRAAGEQHGATTVHCCLQSEVIPLLRPHEDRHDRDDHEHDQPEHDQLSDLARRSQWAALTSDHVWGSHWWLLQEPAQT